MSVPDRRQDLVAAADVGGTRLRMALASADGTRVAHWATTLEQGRKTPAAVVSGVRMGLEAMLQETGRERRHVRHLTVGAPGITNPERGIVVAAPNLEGWTDLPLGLLVQQELGLPCTVDNDVNLAAVGEHAVGAAQGSRHFVFLALGTGVGAGLFLNGQLHRGASWTAGEVGYLPVHGKEREPLRLLATGQLESTIGGAGIEAMWRDAMAREGKRAGDQEHLHAPQILSLAAEGDPLAREVASAVARILADAIGMISVLLDPEVVVLGGGIGAHPFLLLETERLLAENEFARPILRSSTLGTEAQLLGGIHLALAALRD